MAIILNAQSIPAFEQRLRQLSCASPRQWGSMEVTTMVRHLRFTLEVSLGEAALPDESIPVVRRVIFHVFFRWFTNWPKARIKGPPAFFPPPDHDFDGECAALLERMRQFVSTAEAQPDRKAVTPLLGPLTLREWAAVHGAHTHHHFRQFNV